MIQKSKTYKEKKKQRHIIPLTFGCVLIILALIRIFSSIMPQIPKSITIVFIILGLYFIIYGRKQTNKKPPHTIDKGRRSFITFSATLAQNESIQAVSDKVVSGISAFTGKRNPKSDIALIPAGGNDMEEYNKLCNSCMDCVSVCPKHILEPVLKLGHAIHPRISFRTGWCPIDCVKCTEVCTTGALKKILPEEKSSIQIGYAVWVRENCVSISNGEDCYICENACPKDCIQMVRNGRKLYPIVNTYHCIGCGACENKCPASPLKAIYVEGYKTHRRIIKEN